MARRSGSAQIGRKTGIKRKPGAKAKSGPGLVRQLLIAAVVLIALLGGFGLGLFFMDSPGEPQKAAKSKAWYKTQKPPPTMILIPDEPLIPEIGNGADRTLRAYEEALPKEIYEPPEPKLEPPTGGGQHFGGPGAVPEPTIAQSLAMVPVKPSATDSYLPPWRKFAVKAPATNGRPRIVLVIDDMGIDRKLSGEVVGFKGPLTLSYLAYSDDLQKQTASATAAGHELLLHVSMEPGNGALDPGPNVLKTDLSVDEIQRRLLWGFSRVRFFVGINNHMGSKFTENSKGMTVVMQELKKRGFLYLDSRTTGSTVGPRLARQFGVPFAERNIFLDHVNDVAAVRSRLDEVERLARRRGLAIAIGHPRRATLAALRDWLPGLEKKGFVLAPLSSAVKAPQE